MLIMLPTPFLNSIPAVIIIIMGLTILSSNRRLLWINMSFSLLALGFIGSTLYVGLDALVEEINGFIKSY
ncbi:MAG: exopolysaccharide biosynthesis protein, partial [Syntrophomonadaceae bacterium]|nr:exopolysaccharide biosynthesis protein [Syntrophomonadaceae bacterium]